MGFALIEKQREASLFSRHKYRCVGGGNLWRLCKGIGISSPDRTVSDIGRGRHKGVPSGRPPVLDRRLGIGLERTPLRTPLPIGENL